MDRKKFLLFLGGVLAALLPVSASADTAQTTEAKAPPTYIMQLIGVADADPPRWIILWSDVAYESLSSPQLRFAIPQLPKGTMIIWPTQCKVHKDGTVFGPNKQQLNEFGSYCKRFGVVFHQSIP